MEDVKGRQAMRLADNGTGACPWIVFGSDSDTGVSIINGKAVWVLDGETCDITDWLNGIQKKGQIDRMTKYAIMAAMATGDGVLSAIMRRFSIGG